MQKPELDPLKALLDEIERIIVSRMVRLPRTPSLALIGARSMIREVLRLRSLVIDIFPPRSFQDDIEYSLNEVLRGLHSYTDHAIFRVWRTLCTTENDKLISLRKKLEEYRAPLHREFPLVVFRRPDHQYKETDLQSQGEEWDREAFWVPKGGLIAAGSYSTKQTATNVVGNNEQLQRVLYRLRARSGIIKGHQFKQTDERSHAQEIEQIAAMILPTEQGKLAESHPAMELLGKILGPDQSPSTGCLRILGVIGSGGTGKTVLLFRMMMHALLRASIPVIFAELPDEEPTDEDLMVVQTSMLLQLGDQDHKSWEGFDNLDVGREFLRASLKRRAAISHKPLFIAIDNVWRALDLKRLLPEGVDWVSPMPCIFAITSRIQGMVEALQQIISDKEKQRVPVFTWEQKPLVPAASEVLSVAYALQARHIANEVDELIIEDQLFTAMYRMCDGIPLAIRQLVESVFIHKSAMENELFRHNSETVKEIFLSKVTKAVLKRSLRRVGESAQRALVEIAMFLHYWKGYIVESIVGDAELKQLTECNLVEPYRDQSRRELESCTEIHHIVRVPLRDVLVENIFSCMNSSFDQDVELRGFTEGCQEVYAQLTHGHTATFLKHLEQPFSKNLEQPFLKHLEYPLPQTVIGLKYLFLVTEKPRHIRGPTSFASMTNLLVLRIKGPFEFDELIFAESLRYIEICYNNLNLFELSEAQWPINLRHFALKGCDSISELPESIFACINLQSLALCDCPHLQSHDFSHRSAVCHRELVELEVERCPSLLRPGSPDSSEGSPDSSEEVYVTEQWYNRTQDQGPEIPSGIRLPSFDMDKGKQKDVSGQGGTQPSKSRGMPPLYSSHSAPAMKQRVYEIWSEISEEEMLPPLYPSHSAPAMKQREEGASCLEIIAEEKPASGPALNHKFWALSLLAKKSSFPSSFLAMSHKVRKKVREMGPLSHKGKCPKLLVNESSKQLSVHHEIAGKQRPLHEDTQEPLHHIHSDHRQKLTLKERDLQGFKFDELINLRKLKLQYCPSLERLPIGIFYLESLQVLKLHGCSSLQELPMEIGRLIALNSLDVHACEKLKGLPESLSKLTLLEELSLCECTTLEALPDAMGKLSALKTLHIAGCENLSKLPESTSKLVSLVQLKLQGCGMLTELPSGMGYSNNILHALNCLRARARKRLELKVLNLDNCSHFRRLPRKLGNFKKLRTLSLANCHSLKALSSGICDLHSLVRLDLQGCSELQKLPGKFGMHLRTLELLYLMECQSLRRLPSSFCRLEVLTELDMTGCAKLEGLPQQMGRLKALRKLKLAYCKSLRELPDSICKLGALVVMDVHGCHKLRELPAELGKLGKLEILDLRSCERLMSFPDVDGASELHSLRELDLRWSLLEILVAEKGDLYFLGPEKVKNFFKLSREWSTCKPHG